MGAEAITVSSQVVYGHVGNGAAVPALQALGIEAWPVPTVLYSNHPGHGAFAGESLSAETLAALLDGLGRLGVPARAAGVMSGYLREPAQAELVSERIRAWRSEGFDGLYLCDPVLGDDHTGLYVPEALAEAVRDSLVPQAAIVTPNRFELAWLAGRPVETLEDVRAAAAELMARGPGAVVCTSAPGGDSTEAATVALDAGGAWLVRTPRLETGLHGAGDLFAALVFGLSLQGRPLEAATSGAASAVFATLTASIEAGGDELALVAALPELASPAHRFAAIALDRG